jgi:hypothetical protein
MRANLRNPQARHMKTHRSHIAEAGMTSAPGV